MRVFTVLLCLLLAGSLSTFGQNQPPTEIAKRIQQAKSSKAKFQTASVFEAAGEVKSAGKFKSMVADGQLLHLDLTALQGLFKANHEAIEFELPLPEKKKMTLELVRHELLTDDFSVVTSESNGAPINWQPGIYYRGIVKGDPTSLAAISVFDGEVMGIISTDAEGDMVLGKTDSIPIAIGKATDYIFYKERDLLLTNDFHCETEDTPVDTSKDPELGSSKVLKCVRAYLECEHDLVTEKGGATGATNFITGLFNVVALLYQNEQITTNISQVFTWTTPDSYPTSSTSAALNSFKSTRSSYNGDVAHLISRGAPSGGGIAWVDALCSSYSYAYSYINSTYQGFPTYSWSVEVVTHEMGHNLGSPHTHACAWNGNNTAIDGCGPQAGANEGCNAALPPAGGGTIMSYCHLVSGVGISFTNGFGTQPGNRVRTEATNAPCLLVCGSSCMTVTVTGGNVTCNGGNNGTASAANNSTHPPFTYAWSNGGNTPTLNNLAAGTYTVTVTDATGCTGTGSRTVSQPAVLTLTTAVTNASSGNNGAIDLSVSGGASGYSYSWSNGANTQDINALAAGTYTVTVTDASNCTGTKSASVSGGGGGGSGCTNTVSNFPYNESFESGLGLWTQNTNDNMNWTRLSGATPTANTGPSAAQAGSYYLYTEATGYSPNYTGILTGPCFNLAGVSNPNLTFQYHLYGSTMGTLKVEASTNGGTTFTTIWTKTGNQGNAWTLATVSLASYQGMTVQIRFSGTTGSSYYSDMAIDAIQISGGAGGGCSNPPLLNFAVTNTSGGANNGAINLTVANGTPAFTYAWSNGATTQDLSNLAPGTYSVTVTDAATCVVTGSATVANGSNGGGGTCTPVVNLPSSNGFESGTGDWSQATNDDMDWTLQTGGTPTSYTGPNSAYSGTKYAFTEATNNSGKTAILLSSCYDFSTANDPFISFNYHMYGGSMGSLKLEISANGGSTWTTLWTRTGHQGTTWRSAVIYMTGYQTTVKFRFVGLVAGNTSDMALDAINVGSASNMPEGLEPAEMPEPEQEMTLSLSPNPTRHDLNVRFNASMEHPDSHRDGQIFVTDQVGKIMREETVQITEGENNLLLSVEDLPAGMYFLLLRAGENRITEKFIVLK